MHLLFDKYKLLDYEDGVFKQAYPAADTFRRMNEAFGDIEHVQPIELSEHPNIYLFEIKRHKRGPIFVVWEKRDAFLGDDQPPTSLTIKWSKSKPQAMNVFGDAIPTQVIDGRSLHLSVSHTPVFIES